MTDAETVEKPRRRKGKSATPLTRSLGYHVRQLSESWSDVMHRLADAHGVTQGQWRYLRELWEEDGLSQRELSERVGRQGPTTVAALKLLERAGFAEVVRSEHDRRRTQVYLTERGRALEAELAPIIQQVEDVGLADLSAEEVKTFKHVLVRIQQNLDAHSKTRNPWSSWRTQQLADDIRSESQ